MKSASMVSLQPGDKVKWIPSVDHALEQLIGDTKFPWKHGLLDEQTGKFKRELSTQETLEYLRAMEGAPHLRKLLIPLRPQVEWDAIVREVNADGTVNLDIKNGNLPGVTLHYDNVSIDPEGKRPGTCH